MSASLEPNSEADLMEMDEDNVENEYGDDLWDGPTKQLI